MAKSIQESFFEQYASLAMQQQVRYGIPASVTLAQMALESGYGTGRAIKEANNAFCVKCGKSDYWNQEGRYILISDDKSNERFRKYDSLEQSFTDHSKVLMSGYYKKCHSLDSTDYKGWAHGLHGVYASDKNYEGKIIGVIKTYNLDRYDQQALELARRENKTVGYSRGSYDIGVSKAAMVAQPYMAAVQGTVRAEVVSYRLPVGDGTKIIVTSEYGDRHAPTKGASDDHKGIDIRAKFTDVYSMEHGKVVEVGSDKKSGNYVKVEYERADGSNYRVSYCHLDKATVMKGQTVEAGDVIALSGQSGVGTGPHLHLTVKQRGANGKYDYVNPLDYLAELSVRGMPGAVNKKGSNADLLADRRANVNTTPTPFENLIAQRGAGLNQDQLRNAEAGLMAQTDGDQNMNNPRNALLSMLGLGGMGMGMNGMSMAQGGPFSGLISALFTALIGMAIQMDYGKDGAKNDMAQDVKPEEDVKQTEQERQATRIRLTRDSVDPEKAKELAMMNFDAEYPEEKQGGGQRLS